MHEPSSDSPPDGSIGAWLHSRSSRNQPPDTGILPFTRTPSREHGTDSHSPDRRTDKIEKQHDAEKHISTAVCDTSSSGLPPPAPPPAIEQCGEPTAVRNEEKLPVPSRIWHSIRIIISSSWINVLLLFVPAGIALGALRRSQGDKSPISPTVIFAVNAVAIIPLAYLLGFATENVARKMGDKIGALLNVTFGNAVELIIL
ncbi:predicted protein [Uncinocarpus reesii 1704]|uniref:Sodium/calcium exchanger membrane region domain-containing protein n=1 Tax=Uncinocarpus reesii (strain UAMH 1704) TaxID=336963 RepID=C4JZH3_UNCRE|nr:uncharacterized protein UREG_07574 [Uncinocarpus reesii 1704]EEP82709.1 predicted protein [Uncinocarpus reesii 1704]